jgi:hypothetical protein
MACVVVKAKRLAKLGDGIRHVLDESGVAAIKVARGFAYVPEMSSAKQGVKCRIAGIELDGLQPLFLDLWYFAVVVAVIHLPEALNGGLAGIERVVAARGPCEPGGSEQSTPMRTGAKMRHLSKPAAAR